MANYNSHPNYNTSKDKDKNGGSFGYLGRGENYYTDQELKDLGEGVVNWIQQDKNIWCKYYFAMQGMSWQMVQKLCARSEMFKEYLDLAKVLQESKLCTEPYYKEADGNHARFMLARHHKGEWEDKAIELNNKVTFKQIEQAVNEEIRP